MDDDKKKLVKIIVIVACLVLAIGITVVTQTGGGGGGSNANRKMTLLCIDEDCGASFELTSEEFRNVMQESMGEGESFGRMGLMTATVSCKECGEKTAMIATVCGKCGEVFIMDPMAMEEGGYSDECPECGFSAIEARRNKK